jgi:hypothetical protein
MRWAASVTVASGWIMTAGRLISSAATVAWALALPPPAPPRHQMPQLAPRFLRQVGLSPSQSIAAKRSGAGCSCLSSRSASETNPEDAPAVVEHRQGAHPQAGQQFDQLLVRRAFISTGYVPGHHVLDPAVHETHLRSGGSAESPGLSGPASRAGAADGSAQPGDPAVPARWSDGDPAAGAKAPRSSSGTQLALGALHGRHAPHFPVSAIPVASLTDETPHRQGQRTRGLWACGGLRGTSHLVSGNATAGRENRRGYPDAERS